MNLLIIFYLSWLLYCTWRSRGTVNGRLYCFGGGSNSTSSNPVTNQQAAADSGVAVGAGSQGVSVTYSDASPEALALAQNALDTATATQNAALNDSVAALATSAGVATQAIQSNTDVTSEALNTVTNLVAANQTAFANLTAQSIQSALQIAGNASPQTPAATQEILAGTQPVGTNITSSGATTPTTTTTTGTKTLEEIMVGVAFLLGGWILTNHFKK